MEKDRKKPNLQVHIVHFNIQLKKFLASQSFLTELDFIDAEIGKVQETIKEYEHIVAHSVSYVKLSDDYLSFWLGSEKLYLEWLKQRKTTLKDQDRPGLRSFKWDGTSTQKKALWQALIKAGYIAQATSEERFIAVFSGQVIDNYYSPITWILQSRKGRAHKTALRDFLTILLEIDPFPSKLVPHCFIDTQNRPIHLAKPKKMEHSKYYMDIEKMINKVKAIQ